MTICYFTASGNCLYVARRLGGTLLSIPQLMRQKDIEIAEPILRKDTALGYMVNDKCVRCGVCAKVCPANNITVTETGVKFSDRCEVCYACLHNCPQNAIHLTKEANTVRFRNEHITLADIIKANG